MPTPAHSLIAPLRALRIRAATAWERHPLLVGGLATLAVILIANPYLLHRRGYLFGDAVDNWLTAFRWYGAAGRAGHFPDYFPFAFSGFSHGWSPEFGLYQPLYQLCALLFPDSHASVKLCYLILLLAIWALAFLCARQLELSPVTSTYVGWGLLASGFVVGHAQHLSYLASAVALLATWAGLLASRRHAYRGAALGVGVGLFVGATAGYPTILLFGAQLLLAWFLIAAARRQLSWRGVGAVALGAAGGLLLAGPALAHAWRGIALSQRASGLPLEQVMAPFGSLPLGSAIDLVWPYRSQPLPGVDISMDRFHALLLTTVLVVIGLSLLRSPSFRSRFAARFLTLLALAGGLFVLATGDQLLPLRRALAESSILYRLGRFVGAEHQPFALLCWVLASAWVVEHLVRRSANARRLILVVGLLELGLLYAATGPVRLTLARPTSSLAQPMGRLPVALTAEDQPLLDRPRYCERIPPVAYQEVYSRGEWSGWGYSALRLADYAELRQGLAPLLCAGGRLFSWPSGERLDYRLRRYEPGVVEIELAGVDAPPGAELLWAETTDGFWQLTINDQPAVIEAAPASLRRFRLPAETTFPARLRMTYRGPLSRLFR